MIILEIPGRDKIELKYVLFDMNGTLTVDGSILNSTKEKLQALSKKLKIFVLTADTFGKAKLVFEKLPVELFIVDKNNGTDSKNNFLLSLGAENCISIGNGVNDTLMLKNSALSIGVLMEEGIATSALFSADILTKNINDAIDLLLNPKRIIATLRK